jgi:hypothetical protein
MEVGCQLNAMTALPPRTSPKNKLNRRLGSLQNRSGSGGEEEKKNFLIPAGKGTTVVQPVAYS